MDTKKIRKKIAALDREPGRTEWAEAVAKLMPEFAAALDEVDRLAGLVSEAHELLDADCDDAAFDKLCQAINPASA